LTYCVQQHPPRHPTRRPSDLLTLDSDAQRDIFIEAFWKRHAPAGMSGDAYRLLFHDLIEEGTDQYRRGTDRYTVYVVNGRPAEVDRKSTRPNSSHEWISYAGY